YPRAGDQAHEYCLVGGRGRRHSDQFTVACGIDAGRSVSARRHQHPLPRTENRKIREMGAFAWELAKVRALFAESIDVAANVAIALGAANLDPAQDFEVSRIEDQDWVRATQSQFKPVQISRRLWVVPTW